jgi:hypothetical protein
VDIPVFGGQWQRAQVQVPQLVSWRLNERFRWPTDQVLLLSCGVVASPVPDGKAGGNALTNLLGSAPSRADALLFLECLATLPGPPAVGNPPAIPGFAPTDSAARPGVTGGISTRGRY